MLEGELESAICAKYEVLLPDLAREGYLLLSRQAILHGRRLDLLLQRPSDGHHCIVELKSGSPPMPMVRDQILDYARCWRVSYPNDAPPRLIVIGTSMPETTRKELANLGIEARAINATEVIAAFEQGLPRQNVQSGLMLATAETAKVRELLSDHELLMIPDGMILAPPWDNLKVCLALAKRGENHKDLWKKNVSVHLYEQKPGCAVLYLPTTVYWRAPLHLNRRRSSWRPEVFRRIERYVRFSHSDNKGKGREGSNFEHYVVEDWNGFAEGLGF